MKRTNTDNYNEITDLPSASGKGRNGGAREEAQGKRCGWRGGLPVFAGIVCCPCILLQFTIVSSQSYSLTIIPIVSAITSVPIAILILQL